MTTVTISEKDLQDAIVDAARLYGYVAFHSRPAITGKGWRTPVQYDGKGFPDLVLVGRERVIFAEIKSDRGKPTVEQEQWLAGLERVAAVSPTVRVHVWSPADWPDRILEELAR